MALSKNQFITVTVQAMGVSGEGIAKYENLVVFIPFAITGEKIKAKVILVKKRYAIAKIIEVLTPAEERVRPECQIFSKCGGCQFQHLKYQNQLKVKYAAVAETLQKVAKLLPEVQPCVRSERTYQYRNKLTLPVSEGGDGINVGFYADNSHRIVPLESCPLHSDWMMRIVDIVKEFAEDNNVTGYMEEQHCGILRHIVIKEFNDQFMVILVINADFIDCAPLSEKLDKVFNKYSLYLNINKQVTNTVLSDNYIHISGEELLKDTCLGIRYEVGPASFMQINNGVRDKIYQKVAEIVRDNYSCCPAIDAYSGAGILTAVLAKYCSVVYGVEIVPEAVNAADRLTEQNNLSGKVQNILGDCAKILPELLSRHPQENLVLVLDPPRKGCDKEIIRSIIKAKPRAIVYISCNPATLARDLGYIIGSLNMDEESASAKSIGSYKPLYNIELVQPYDMFPQTKHVECLVWMSRVN